MKRVTQAAAALCRLWTTLYTVGLPDRARASRRAEIESDLWESATDDRRPAAAAGSIVTRLLLGLPYDVLWRLEQRDRRVRWGRRSILTAGAALLLVTAAWTWMTLRIELPEPAPAMSFIASPAPPPPPPPPPPPDWYLKRGAQVARERSRAAHR